MNKDEIVRPDRTLRSLGLEQSGVPRSRAAALHRFANDHTVTIVPSGAVCTYIPKNACSTLRYSVLRANDVDVDPESPNFRHLDVSSFRSTPDELSSATHTFVILRCPYRRLVSMFVDKMLGGGRGLPYLIAHDRLGGFARWRRLLRISGKAIRFFGLHAPELQKDYCFRDVVQFLSKPGVLVLDHHWRPQVDFLIFDRYDSYFSVEDLSSCQMKLSEKHVMQLLDARALTKHGVDRANTVTDGFFGDTPISVLAEMKRRGLIPDSRSFYDDEIRSRVSAIYSDDIELYRRFIGGHGLMFEERTGSIEQDCRSAQP
jgi:hypothetical protein